MAALTIKPVDIQTIGTPSSFPIQSSSSNYLNHCVEELKPENVANSTIRASLWKTAGIVTLLAWTAFIGMSAGIIGLGALTGSMALFGTGFLLISSFKYLAPLIERCADRLFDKEDRIRALQELSQRFNALPTDANLLAIKLASMAIFWRAIPGAQQPEDLHRFKALIAHHDYWVNQQVLWEQKARADMAVADQVTKLDPNTKKQLLRGDPGDLITKRLKAAYSKEQEALVCKVHAAFIHAVIMRPDFVGDFGKLANFHNVSYKTRIIAQQCGNTALANDLVRFQNVQALTLNDVKTQPITVLAYRFIQAMPAA